MANAEVSGKKVIVFQHIPYGMDLFSSAKAGKGVPVINPEIQSGYLNALKQYASIITTVYAGHFHNEFLSLPYTTIPLISTIAFNSYRDNNPGFKIASISSDGYVQNYTTYTSTLGEDRRLIWMQLYNSSTAYGNSDMATVINSLSYDGIKASNYQLYHGGNTPFPGPITDAAKWKYYYCDIKYVEESTYNACINSQVPY